MHEIIEDILGAICVCIFAAGVPFILWGFAQ